MCNFTKQQYEYALRRIEELIDIVPDCEPTASKEAMELSIMSEIVMEYEDEHFSMQEDMEEMAEKKSGIDLALEDVKARRVNEYASAEEMFEKLGI